MDSYQLSKKADSDIARLYEYGITHFGIDSARKYLLGLHNQLQDLANLGHLLSRDASYLAPHLRRIDYKSHSIFYLDNHSPIKVVRVLRQEMDFSRHID